MSPISHAEADVEGSEDRADDDEPPTQADVTAQDALVRDGTENREE